MPQPFYDRGIKMKFFENIELGTVHLIFRGGGLGFLVRAKIFFSDKIGARLFLSPALLAGLFFFSNKKLHL